MICVVQAGHEHHRPSRDHRLSQQHLRGTLRAMNRRLRIKGLPSEPSKKATPSYQKGLTVYLARGSSEGCHHLEVRPTASSPSPARRTPELDLLTPQRRIFAASSNHSLAIPIITVSNSQGNQHLHDKMAGEEASRV
jgi:hypothetical protein